MQVAGDTRDEPPNKSTVGTTLVPSLGGLIRWFPRGFATEGIHWTALEEHLSMVPDLAFEVSSESNCGESAKSVTFATTMLQGTTPTFIPKGIGALHLAVACNNPPAPLSLIQKILEVNPSAVNQTNDEFCWNVLYFAIKYNRHLHEDQQRIVELLLQTNPDLARLSVLSSENDLPALLAHANCKEVVPILVNVTEKSVVFGVLNRIFVERKLLGGSIEAMEQVVRVMSVPKNPNRRRLLIAGILPKKKRALDYLLAQTLSCEKGSQEQRDLARLVDVIIQSTYCSHFCRAPGDEMAIYSSPRPVECIKALIKHSKTGVTTLEQWTALHDDDTSLESVAHVGETDQPCLVHQETFRGGNGQQLAAAKRRVTKPVGVDTFLKQLVTFKNQLDGKMEKSMDTLKHTTATLEGYREMYSSTIDNLVERAQALKSPDLQTTTAAGRQNIHEDMAFVRENSGYSADAMQENNPNAPTMNLEDSIREAIENMKVIGLALDRCNRNLAAESAKLISEQEDQKSLDMNFFCTFEKSQAKQAALQLLDSRIEQEALVKCIEEITRKLAKVDGTKQTETTKAQQRSLHLEWIKLTGELKDVHRKIEKSKEIVDLRRKNVGGTMIKARRVLNSKIRSKNIRQTARQFLREAKREMKELMAASITRIEEPGNGNRHLNRYSKRKQQRKQGKHKVPQQRENEETEEELTHMTKRMKLSA